MSDTLMLEAALFQLRAAESNVTDEFTATQLRLTLGVLVNAIAAAKEGVNAALVGEIEFALNDVVAAVGDLPVDEAAAFEAPLVMLRDDLEQLRSATQLPADVMRSLGSLQAKLKERRRAIERQTYVEGGSSDPLPHPPQELRNDAVPLRDALAAAGYLTPALDTLIEDPESLRFHSINEIVNELDVISGA